MYTIREHYPHGRENAATAPTYESAWITARRIAYFQYRRDDYNAEKRHYCLPVARRISIIDKTGFQCFEILLDTGRR